MGPGTSHAKAGALVQRLLALLVLALAGLGALWSPDARAQKAFDHTSTGYALTGAHQDVRCETCHVKGVFKGTPRDCATCHAQGNVRNALAMPASHVRTSYACDTCHSTTRFGGAQVNHASVPTASCASCHNNVSAKGKPANHLPTTAGCDQCHTVTGFAPVLRFDHAAQALAGRTCASCHDNRIAKGQPANHVPTAARCENCHQASVAKGYTAFSGGVMDHAGITAGCASCHADGVADSFAGVRILSKGKLIPGHLPTGDNCEACHRAPAVPIPVEGAAAIGNPGFAGGSFVHTGITRGCDSCHGAATAASFYGVTPKSPAGLNPPHLPTTASCETCHANATPTVPLPATGNPALASFANGR